jgi:hypothetical protein
VVSNRNELSFFYKISSRNYYCSFAVSSRPVTVSVLDLSAYQQLGVLQRPREQDGVEIPKLEPRNAQPVASSLGLAPRGRRIVFFADSHSTRQNSHQANYNLWWSKDILGMVM